MNRYVRPVLFAFEPDAVFIFGRVTFGAAGAPTLDGNNSKGLCNVTRNSIAFTGTTANASPTISGVSSFAGLYVGMTVKDTGPTNVNSTISSMNPGAGTITMAGNATGTNTGLVAAGGQYTIQLGQQAGVRLDVYNKLLRLGHLWDESGSQGGASTGASTPAAPSMLLIGNKVSIRTVPPTVAGNLTDATIQVQFGTFAAGTFVAVDPSANDVLRLELVLSRSGAI